MKITSVKFIKSVDRIENIPKPAKAEIAFAGRSNVGKSRLLNTMVNRKNIAQISKTPGKTRLVNYYLVNDKFYFVDLPGYGFARVSKTQQQQWAHLIETYLIGSIHLCGVVVIIDARHGLTANDTRMIDYLIARKLRYTLVATKADKLSANQLAHNLDSIKKNLAGDKMPDVCLFSSITGMGKEQLWKSIKKFLNPME